MTQQQQHHYQKHRHEAYIHNTHIQLRKPLQHIQPAAARI